MYNKVICNLGIVMEDAGYSVTKLSEESGIDRATIYKYINRDVYPTITNALILADILCCNVEDIWWLK